MMSKVFAMLFAMYGMFKNDVLTTQHWQQTSVAHCSLIVAAVCLILLTVVHFPCMVVVQL